MNLKIKLILSAVLATTMISLAKADPLPKPDTYDVFLEETEKVYKDPDMDWPTKLHMLTVLKEFYPECQEYMKSCFEEMAKPKKEKSCEVQ